MELEILLDKVNTKSLLLFLTCATLVSSDWSEQPCLSTDHVPGSSLGVFAGLKLYTRYLKGLDNYSSEIDSLTWQFNKVQENQYVVQLSMVTNDKKHSYMSFNWIDFPENQVITDINEGSKGNQMYAIPFLERNSTMVLYMCQEFDDGHHRHILQVLSLYLNHDVTKALEAARKIAVDVKLPFKHRTMI
uniref:Lipocalin/cytosolic fatty-acid binding domain-containing protein n=2 Tax=Clastoptera arizonana TaxID=38151 RepID=A0A1B6DHU9_9HEMI